MTSTAGSIVFRPSVVGVLSTVVAIAIVIPVVVVVVFGDQIAAPLVFVAVFGIGQFIARRTTSLELGRDTAIIRGVGRVRTVARADVRGVDRGRWWRGGITIRTTSGTVWSSVGDLPFGDASASRVAAVRR